MSSLAWTGGAGLASLLVLAHPAPSSARLGESERAGHSAPMLPAARSALTGGVTRLRSPGPLMIRVPGGTFHMGSTPDEVFEVQSNCNRESLIKQCNDMVFENEIDKHELKLEPFFLDRTEVTVGAYRRCVERGRCEPLRYAEGARRFEHDDYPATFVSWAEARSYCQFRGARLASEAEFERAARGSTRRVFPWGNLYNSHAVNHGRLGHDATDRGDGYAELAPVGAFPAGRTPDGFLDLAGNVEEWVEDAYTLNYQLTRLDPNQPVARVTRGGSYLDPASRLRGAARMAHNPDARGPYIGFRCARSAGATIRQKSAE